MSLFVFQKPETMLHIVLHFYFLRLKWVLQQTFRKILTKMFHVPLWALCHKWKKLTKMILWEKKNQRQTKHLPLPQVIVSLFCKILNLMIELLFQTVHLVASNMCTLCGAVELYCIVQRGVSVIWKQNDRNTRRYNTTRSNSTANRSPLIGKLIQRLSETVSTQTEHYDLDEGGLH